jgi:ABC-2 type transport system permease protein
MLGDIRTVAWKEWKELLSQHRRLNLETLSVILAIGGTGTLAALSVGSAWVGSPFVLVLSSWVPLLLASSVVADSFAGERERHTLETLLATRLSDTAILLGKILTIQTYAWSLTLAMLMVSLVAVNVGSGATGLLFFSPSIALAAVLTSCLSSGMAACAGVLVSLRSPGVKYAQQLLGAASVLVFLLFFSIARISPIDWLGLSSNLLISRLTTYTAVPLAALLVLLFILSKWRFRREKLMLD